MFQYHNDPRVDFREREDDMSKNKGVIQISISELKVLMGLPEDHEITHIEFNHITTPHLFYIAVEGDSMPEYNGILQILERKVVFE